MYRVQFMLDTFLDFRSVPIISLHWDAKLRQRVL